MKNHEQFSKSKSNGVVFIVFISVILFIVLAFSLFNYCFSFVIIGGASMENTFVDGDVVLENKVKDIERGDVVTIQNKKQVNIDGETVSELIIKRVIAIEGDTLYIYNGRVWLKKAGETEFTQLEESYVKQEHSTFYPNPTDSTNWEKSAEITIGAGEYYFLGDNRMDSRDSRDIDFGTCTREDIVGVVTQRAIDKKEKTTKFFYGVNKINKFLGLASFGD